MDRNNPKLMPQLLRHPSLSARRAWIEIHRRRGNAKKSFSSLSARRAWIEIRPGRHRRHSAGVALRKESVDRNVLAFVPEPEPAGRSPQGERG